MRTLRCKKYALPCLGWRLASSETTRTHVGVLAHTTIRTIFIGEACAAGQLVFPRNTDCGDVEHAAGHVSRRDTPQACFTGLVGLTARTEDLQRTTDTARIRVRALRVIGTKRQPLAVLIKRALIMPPAFPGRLGFAFPRDRAVVVIETGVDLALTVDSA